MPGTALTRNRILAAGGVLLAIAAVLLTQQLTGGDASATPIAKASKSLSLVQKTFRISKPNEYQRLEVKCPGSSKPYGGGMTASPPPGPDGEGAYPLSYERLGKQHGYHSTVVLIDPGGGNTEARDVTLQVKCGKKPGKLTPPHTIASPSPGDTKTILAKCPGKRALIGGGFQRTNFTSSGGSFALESRATSSKTWRVVGSAFGGFGGEVVSIGYCIRSKKPLLSEVSGTATVATGAFATATTPPCSGRRQLAFGGFATTGSNRIFMTNGAFTSSGTWTSSAYNFGAPATLTAYGYCLRT